jgi:hypothetical protein
MLPRGCAACHVTFAVQGQGAQKFPVGQAMKHIAAAVAKKEREGTNVAIRKEGEGWLWICCCVVNPKELFRCDRLLAFVIAG